MAKKIERFYQGLKYEYRLFQELMDSIPDVIYFKDTKGRLVMVNRAHAKGLGLKPQEVAGKTDFDFFPRQRAQKMADDDRKVLKSGKAIIDKVERATRPDGIDNYVSTTKIPRYDSKGKIIGLIGITRDITHRKQIDRLEQEKNHIKDKLEALQEVAKLKSGFVSTVSHELRTPLAIIKEAVGIISESLAGPVSEKQKEILSKATNNIIRLQHIIDELLDISRIETGRLKLHYSLVNLNELVIDSADFFKKLVQEKKLILDYRLPKEELNIFVDAERIIQVINNLINNAIKFTEEGGKIKVEVKLLENKVRVSVIDSGVGIAKQDLAKLFNRFVQVSRVAGADKKGVGLGLSIAKELIEKHNGEIWAESRPGSGSKFYFTLPLFYSPKIFDKDFKEKLNSLLKREATVYLINLLLMRFAEIAVRMKVEAVKISSDLKEIIEKTFKSLSCPGQEAAEIASMDAKGGECSIIFPGATEQIIKQACDLLKKRLKGYFTAQSIKNIFINIGKSPLEPRDGTDGAKQVSGNFYIKRIYVGLNKRMHERFCCRIQISVSHKDKWPIASRTIDISRGGLCFSSSSQLATDEKIKIKLELAGDNINLEGLVRWIKLPKESVAKVNEYQVGVEYFGLKGKNKKIINNFIAAKQKEN